VTETIERQPTEGEEAIDSAPHHGSFPVKLENFEGPFDLLLQLIGKHRLDVTEVALSQVTDDFIAHIRAMGDGWDLGQATEFLVVAATLLDLKAARLLPAGEVEDEEDLALLEARDLLFARLLQYKAFKEVAALFSTLMESEGRRQPRSVGVEAAFAGLLPELTFTITADQFALVASRALAPKPVPTVGMAHLHSPKVSVREQAQLLVERLRRLRSSTFRSLAHDAPDTATVVARFLALLELYREGVVSFEQVAALGELHIRWTGEDEAEVVVTDEFDAEDSVDDSEDQDSDVADITTDEGAL
jgi:segregation and condensation protein A